MQIIFLSLLIGLSDVVNLSGTERLADGNCCDTQNTVQAAQIDDDTYIMYSTSLIF
jgi:hypothetical protein